MKFLLVAVLFFVAINAESYIPNSADPNHPGDCLHKDLNLPIKQGETIYPTNIEQCHAFTCNPDGLIVVSNCQRVMGICEKAKYVKMDYTKPYPDCCEHYTYPDGHC